MGNIKPSELTYQRRLTLALQQICGERPPATLVTQWMAGDSSDLQEWAAQHDPFGWVMGIAIMDAAEAMACGIVPRGACGGQWDEIPRDEEDMPKEKARIY
jgi:hypothetical protein